jgi:capsular exopolysaccharide synthesis family protein
MAFLPTLGVRGENIEQFRDLRSKIYQFRDQGPLKTILISSGLPAEGKTFIAANLAMSLARKKRPTDVRQDERHPPLFPTNVRPRMLAQDAAIRQWAAEGKIAPAKFQRFTNDGILLIDADLRGPTIHTILGAPNMPGLTEYLAGSAEVSDILQRNLARRIVDPGGVRSIPNLTFIPAGAGGDNSSELVANHRIEELIETLSPHFDWILIDSPPVLAFADAVDLARAADAVLLVARGASTTFEVAQRTQAAFSNARILGFVLNAVKDAPRNTSDYYGKQKAVSG